MHFWKLSHGWLSLWLTRYYTFVCRFFPLWYQFLVLPPLLGSSGVALLMYPLLFFQFSLLVIFFFSWCNCWIFAWLEFLIGFLDGCTGWGYSVYVSTIVTLRGSALANRFDWDAIFIWDVSWFSCLSFSWISSLTGTLGGTAWGGGGGVFLNISARVINTSLYAFPIFTSGVPGYGFCIAWIKSCGALSVASAEDICGMLNWFRGNSTVSNILTALVLGMYVLWHL